MPLHASPPSERSDEEVSIRPEFAQPGELQSVPRFRLADQTLPAQTAYQLVHDELLLDGNSRLNLATFVGTWMEPQARVLIEECLDKNIVDRDESPQTAELELRCVSILAELWNSPAGRAGHRLLDDRLQRGVHARRARAEVALARTPPRRRQAH